MSLRGNLFVKVFVGFWLVTLAILASWMLTNEYFEAQPGESHLQARGHQGPPHRFVLRFIYNLQNLDDAALGDAIIETRAKHNVEIYLLDKNGIDFLQREVPARVRDTARQLKKRRRGFLNTPKERFVAHEIYRREQGPMRAVFVFPSRRPGVLQMLGRSPGLRIGLAVLISGLVCYALSRALTSRIQQLRHASRRLADGELDTRAPVRVSGGDETDELARDFNTMAEHLQARIQAQKRLISDVSHELRSPLARLRIALALAQEDQTQQASHLARIEKEAHRLEDLIAQLLASQAGSVELDTHIDLVRLLQQLSDDANFEGKSASKRVVFTTGAITEPSQAIVGSSGDLLRKSFENILRNALHYTAESSDIQVELSSTGAGYQISFEDRGPGVPNSELDNIFSEFHRVDTSRARESGGYGLGLAIAKRAILQHGGQIKASNTGTGLKIIVTLPNND